MKKIVENIIVEGQHPIADDPDFIKLLEKHNIVGIQGLVIMGGDYSEFEVSEEKSLVSQTVTGVQRIGISLLPVEISNSLYLSAREQFGFSDEPEKDKTNDIDKVWPW